MRFFVLQKDIAMTKIIHTGDLHLDAPLIGMSPEKAEICRNERLMSFESIIDEVIKTNTDILLLAGDIFENDNLSLGTVEFLKKCFARIPDTCVFISPGNHDCINGNRVYLKQNLGDNVHVFGNSLSCVEIESKNIRVYGYGFADKTDGDSLLSGFRVKDDNMANILLVHCSLPPYKDVNPISLDEISESGLDYIAAGHIHAGGEIKREGSTFYAYCGTPQGVSFDETGEKGIIIGEIEKKSVNLSFKKTAKRGVCIKEIDVSDCTTHADVCSKLRGLKPQNIYKIVLKGKTQKHIVFNTKILKDMLEQDLFFVKIADETETMVEKTSSVAENLFLEKLREKKADDKIMKRAEKLGLCALNGERLS